MKQQQHLQQYLNTKYAEQILFGQKIQLMKFQSSELHCTLYIFVSVNFDAITHFFCFSRSVFSFPRFYSGHFNNRRIHLGALVPFGVMLILATVIFIMIIFRRWPGLVSGLAAGCLTFVSIYLLLFTLKEEVLVYE